MNVPEPGQKELLLLAMKKWAVGAFVCDGP